MVNINPLAAGNVVSFLQNNQTAAAFVNNEIGSDSFSQSISKTLDNGTAVTKVTDVSSDGISTSKTSVNGDVTTSVEKSLETTEDGFVASRVYTDGDGNVYERTSTITQLEDGSYQRVIALAGPDGETQTATDTITQHEDGSYSVSLTFTAEDGTTTNTSRDFSDTHDFNTHGAAFFDYFNAAFAAHDFSIVDEVV